jgi:hypothetical protein
MEIDYINKATIPLYVKSKEARYATNERPGLIVTCIRDFVEDGSSVQFTGQTFHRMAVNNFHLSYNKSTRSIISGNFLRL